MSDLVHVKDEPDFARDPESGAIININRSAIQRAREQKQVRLRKQAEDKQLRA